MSSDRSSGGSATIEYYYDDDYYAYDDYDPAPATETETKAKDDQLSNEYDLTELVKAWKEYIKEKSTKEVAIEEYECEPREDSYRSPDPGQCDKWVHSVDRELS